MSPVCNGSVLAPAAPQLVQTSKRTRIELLAAQNDHNYSAARRPNSAANNKGRMDDCTAAMVLMYLSSRPGEEPREQSEVQRSAATAAQQEDESNICKQTAALDEPGAKVAVMKRNSEPIEMNLESQTRRVKHFKRQLPAAHELELEADELEAKQTRTTGEESQAKRRPIGLSDACDFELDDDAEEEEDDTAARKADKLKTSGQLEDEMMFELQQVDQVEPATFAARAAAEEAPQNSKATERARGSVPPRPPPLPVAAEWRPQSSHEATMRRASLSGRRQAGEELGRLAAFELIGSHLEAKKRTIFSCMWPSCPKNCDSLDDIERHVRAHLGPNSIGDEDFYYEETEVDEPTYLAIFGPRQTSEARSRAYHQHHAQPLQFSPSHNSDGLSSGHSFAGSSPATSPVCSADSSSASSSSALSTSSLSSCASSATFQLDGPAGGAAKSQLLAASSLEWSSFLASSPLSGWQSGRSKQQHLGHHRRQQQAALFSLDTFAATNSPRLSGAAAASGLKSSRRQSGKFATLKATGGLKRQQQIQEQLRASIIEQLHSQRQHARPHLQFSMQLSDSSLQLDHANHAHGDPSGRPRKLAGRAAAFDHSYESAPAGEKRHEPPAPPQAETQAPASSLASQIKSRRGRRPSAKLAEQAQMAASAAVAKQTGKRPQLFQHAHADCFQSAASGASAPANSRQRQQQHLPHSPPLSGASSPSSGGSGAGGGGDGKRLRGENRKCRKVYGMEQRDQWCTQCKWKKACSRFCDQQQ